MRVCLLRGLGACLLLGALAGGLAGCITKFADGQRLEQLGRWEEAMLAYRDAVIDEPQDPEFRQALDRARKVVARDNFERYKAFLAQKAFRKAYARLRDAAQQDADYAPVQDELRKWERVLVGGQVRFSFEAAQTSFTLADEISLVIRINTPNPGETIDAEINLDTGMFFAEDLLYDRPSELLALYSVNAIGVDLVFGRTRIKKFTSKEFQRFVNIRTPVLDEITGVFAMAQDAELMPVRAHRTTLPSVPLASHPGVPAPNPRYSLHIDGRHIRVTTPTGGEWPDFTPRFLYVNKRDRRVFVDFGRYQVGLAGRGDRWTLQRLPLAGQDYFADFSRNIALQPYFFYREGVFTYVPARPG